jgi:hypothetical protein
MTARSANGPSQPGKEQNKGAYSTKVQMLDEQPFDFGKIRIIIKKQDESVSKVILLDKRWTHKYIPHF